MLTDDVIDSLWKETTGNGNPTIYIFARFIEARARAEEREACARVCDEHASIEGIAQMCAAMVRTRRGSN